MQDIMQFIGRHQILSSMWIGLLIMVLYTTITNFTSKIKVITCNEVTRLINKENAIVVDLRKYNDFCKGHIVGAINLLPTDIQDNNFSELSKYKNQPIIVIDCTDLQAQEPAKKLNKAGFTKVFILKEGILGWKEQNLPLIYNK